MVWPFESIMYDKDEPEIRELVRQRTVEEISAIESMARHEGKGVLCVTSKYGNDHPGDDSGHYFYLRKRWWAGWYIYESGWWTKKNGINESHVDP